MCISKWLFGNTAVNFIYEINVCTNMITALVAISENLALITKQKADCKLFSHYYMLPLNQLNTSVLISNHKEARTQHMLLQNWQ